MNEKLQAVALRTVKYSDTRSILTAWSAERGMVSLLMPAGTSREARRRRALTQPLCLFECEADIRPGRELWQVKDLHPLMSPVTLQTNGMKAAVSFFLAEVLAKVLRGGGDEAMWQWLCTALREFDMMDMRHAANFHLWFLSRLAVLSGFGPDVEGWSRGKVFSYAEGRFLDAPTERGRCGVGAEAKLARVLASCDCGALARLKLNGRLRGEILEGIIEYYALHENALGRLNSLDVVRML